MLSHHVVASREQMSLDPVVAGNLHRRRDTHLDLEFALHVDLVVLPERWAGRLNAARC